MICNHIAPIVKMDNKKDCFLSYLYETIPAMFLEIMEDI